MCEGPSPGAAPRVRPAPDRNPRPEPRLPSSDAFPMNKDQLNTLSELEKKVHELRGYL